MSRSAPKTVGRAVADVVKHFQEVQYSPVTIEHLRTPLNKFAAFARAKNARYFSSGLAKDFLKHARRGVYKSPHIKTWHNCRVAIRILTEHVSTGSHRIRGRQKELPDLPRFMERAIVQIAQQGRGHLGWSENYIHNQTLWIRRFLEFAHKGGLRNWKSLKIADVSTWLITLESHAASTRRCALTAARHLIKTLFLYGDLDRPLHDGLPMPRFPDDRRLPHIWTQREIDLTLAAIDRRESLGKRDYAIILLALRLGLRSSDIWSLRLDSLLWDKACVAIIQKKTKCPLRLPIPDDVGDALADYLRHARPHVARREVFLRAVSPLGPLTSTALNHTVRKYRHRAGFPAMSGYGMHSLRHTMATRLMENGVPPETIAGLLGHVKIDTTRRYLRTDLVSLRSVGLDPDEEACHV